MPEQTDKLPTSNRPIVSEVFINSAVRMLQVSLKDRLNEKGAGTLASRHEILGILTEEWLELFDACRTGSLKHHVVHELLDIAVAAIFGVACIEAGLLDW